MPKNDVAFELYYDGAWHDLAAADDVFTDAPITITRGQGDSSPTPRPCIVTAKLDNSDDVYRTSNPVSPLYGKAGRNTPTRVSVGGDVRGVVEASSWVCDQSRDFRRTPRRGRAWTEFQGGGLLQRIGQWTRPAKSAFRTYNDALTTVTSYAPLEDKSGTQSPYMPIVGNGLPFVPKANYAGQNRAPGTDQLADFPIDGYVEATTTRAGTTTSGWQLSFVTQFPRNLRTGDSYYQATVNLTNGSSVVLLYTDTNLNIIASDATGTTVISGAISMSSFDFSRMHMVVLSGSLSAGTVTISASYRALADTAWTTHSGTYSDTTTGEVDLWYVGGSTDLDSLVMGHVIVTSGVTEDLMSAARWTALLGHTGELTAVRFGRLCDESSIPYYVSDGWASSTTMGPQPVATFAEHLQEIMSTEDALIFDYRIEARLFMLCRTDRYNQTPALALAAEDLPYLPPETVDDQDVHNIVTVAQPGAQSSARDDTGPLGTQDTPNGVGEYRQTIDLNLYDETELPQYANYWLRRGTVDLPRFPRLVVNLSALSALKLAEAEAVEVGSVITITGYREYTIRLHVLGYTEVIGTHSRMITFTCAPDQQFNVGTYDDTSHRYDSASTTVEDLTPTETLWDLTTTNLGDCWSTTGVPYDVVVNGERCTITAMSAAAGTGPYTQTATARRSVNGVYKSHDLGSEVHIANPGRYGL